MENKDICSPAAETHLASDQQRGNYGPVLRPRRSGRFGQSLENVDDYIQFQPLRTGPQTPSWALDKLSLKRRHPEATFFITTKDALLPPNRVALFFI